MRISSMGSTMANSYQIQTMQSQMNQIAGEIASGRSSTPMGPLGANAALLYQLHAQANQQTTLQTTVTNTLGQLDAVQGAMNSIGTAVQTVATAAINAPGTTAGGSTILANTAQGTMEQVVNLLNTQYQGKSLFSGDATDVAAMQSPNATGGPAATMNSVLAAAVSAKGGPLSASDINNLINGTNGIASVFTDTNTNPAMNYTGAFYTGSTDNKPSTVLVGTGQTTQYNTAANQPAFRDLMQGLSMLGLLNAPSSQLDDSAKAELQNQGSAMISQAQNELTMQQGVLGVTQANLQHVADDQQSAASATQAQILNFEQANVTADSTMLTALQTQLQASFDITAKISQLSLASYLPNLTG